MKWADVDMDYRRRLADRVDASDLPRGERETAIDFFATDDAAEITSYAEAIVRSILKHPEARIKWVYAAGVRDRLAQVRDPSAIPDPARDVKIEGVAAAVPLGTLTVKGRPRKRDRPSGIVTVPDGRERAADGRADQ